MPSIAVVGATLLLPGEVLDDHGLIVDDRIIQAIVPYADLSARCERIEVDGAFLAPGFIDIQVNGGGGVLFNDHPTVEGIRQIGAAHRPYGSTSFLPTLMSDQLDVVKQALASVDQGIAEGVPGLIGIHLEGPFLNEEKRGIHDSRHFSAITDAWLDVLHPPKGGTLLMTVAPETISGLMLRKLRDRGIILAAGHTQASYDETRAALDHGVTGFTHLFNAMPPLLSREPGAVAAALDSDAWCSLIVDGHHVDDAMLRLAIRAKTDNRFVLITDAMTNAGTDASTFRLQDRIIRITDGKCADEAGTLAGSNLTMAQAVKNAVDRLGLPVHEAVSMATFSPACFLGQDKNRGVLREGGRADFTLISKDFNEIRTVVGGDFDSVTTVSLDF